MRKIKKLLKAVGVGIGILLLFLAFLALWNQIALKSEADELVPNGRMVGLGDRRVHVYAEGDNPDAPTLVFLSGAATVAPAYDFKGLYRLLSGEYRITVPEKAGYGYSDIVELERDVGSMVTEVRGALMGAGIEGPYLLLPHSMSGLEAVYWAQNYPAEVAGIAGLDMAVPQSYDGFDFSQVEPMIFWGRIAVKLGLLRIPGLYPLHEAPLTEWEAGQQKSLMYRNAVNIDYVLEGRAVYENAQTVKDGGAVTCPILMFTSNGAETGEAWSSAQEKFARENAAAQVRFDCGHYLHYEKSEEIAGAVKEFLTELAETGGPDG